MSAEAFLDTNILVYAFSLDPKSTRARSLLMEGGVVSVQVLNEFVNVMRNKQRRDWEEIEAALRALHTLCDTPAPLTLDIHRHGLRISRSCSLHIYDSLILAAAIEAGCGMLLTEDMKDGQTIEGVTIRNPFTG